MSKQSSDHIFLSKARSKTVAEVTPGTKTWLEIAFGFTAFFISSAVPGAIKM